MTTSRHPRLARIAAVVTLTAASTAALVAGGAPAGAADSSNKLTITAGEYTFKKAGNVKPGNIEIEFDNAGVEIHMMPVVQLKSGVTAKQLGNALLSDDEAAIDKLVTGQGLNVPGTPGLLSPGEVTTTLSNLKAGHYGLLCFVPAPDGAPHIAHGMVQVFDVKGSKSTLKPPTDGVAEVTITDTAIELPSTGIPKSGWVKVTNEASTPRDLTIAGYSSPTMTFEEADAAFDAFFESGAFPGGSEPATLAGGLSGVAPGKSGYVQVGLDAGRWVFVSSDLASETGTDLHVDFTVS